MKQKTYRIKEFSEHMGISVDLIKHYEKHGVLKPEGKDKSGYRYYVIKQGKQVIESRVFRSMGFSINETLTLMNESTLDDIIKALDDRSNEINAEIKRLSQIEKRITEIKKQSEHFRDEPNTAEIVFSPAYYFLEQTNQKEFNQDESKKKLVKIWMHKFPFVMKSMIIKTSYQDNGYKVDQRWGMAIEEKMAEFVGINYEEGLQYIPARKCLKYTMSNLKPSLEEEDIQEALRKLDALGYKVAGDILIEGWIDSKENNENTKEEHYIFLIPIK